MHILVVTQYFWPENFRINDLVKGLISKGYKVTVLTGKPNYPKGKVYPEFFGTETGAFACLDGFSEQAKLAMKGREVGYNQGSGSNSRQIVPITDAEEVMTGSQLDVLLYMNNFSMIETDAPVIDAEMSVEDAIKNIEGKERAEDVIEGEVVNKDKV